MLSNQSPSHSLTLSSQDSYILSFAIEKAETEPKITQTSKDFFLKLRKEGQKVPDVLTTSLSSRITDLKESRKNLYGYSTPAFKVSAICCLGSATSMELACMAGHPVFMGPVCLTGSALTLGTYHYLKKTCPSNRDNLKTIALESQEKIKTVVLEAIDFSAETENELKNFLEKRIDQLSISLRRPSYASKHLSLQREKDLHDLALTDLLAVTAHYKIEGFTLAVSETEQAEEETSIDSEDAAAPLLIRGGLKRMIIERGYIT
jgi:hypothetical protein